MDGDGSDGRRRGAEETETGSAEGPGSSKIDSFLGSTLTRMHTRSICTRYYVASNPLLLSPPSYPNPLSLPLSPIL